MTSPPNDTAGAQRPILLNAARRPVRSWRMRWCLGRRRFGFCCRAFVRRDDSCHRHSPAGDLDA